MVKCTLQIENFATYYKLTKSLLSFKTCLIYNNPLSLNIELI